MNLLEHYILKVHDVEKVNKEWGSFIKARLTIDCYGCIEDVVTSFSDWEEWEKVKKLGYYMA